ncbi:MAG: TRAP transporter substrate-binding protein DctP [Thermoanaerobaculia bacterium]|nr:TRAP transporter substrate-binding protein DctP [Thermoanaerobaculia bacterium]
MSRSTGNSPLRQVGRSLSWFALAVGLVVLLPCPPAVAQAPVTIKMASLLPAGSEGHNVLLQMAEDWKKASGGRVVLRIYPGQTMGDDPDVVRKMKLGSIQAALLAAVGDIDPSVYALQVPMLYSSYEEVDYVREKISPRLNAALEAKGLVVLNWTDAGWIHFFTKTPVARPDDLRKLKLFTWAGNSEVIEMYKASGFNPVPLPSTEIATALQTGLVTAMPAPPQAAVLLQWYTHAKNMTDVKWALLLGATVISKDGWNRIPADLRPALLAASEKAGRKLRDMSRANGPRDIEAMKKRGLSVVHVDGAREAEWRKTAEAAYPKIRGSVIPAAAFDEAVRHLAAYRKSHPPAATPAK